MAVTVTEKVQILIEVDQRDGTVYRDAIYLTRDERAGMTLQELRDIGQARYVAWKAAVSAPPRELTREEKRAMLEAALHERARIKRELLAADPTDIADVLARPGVPQDELPVGG